MSKMRLKSECIFTLKDGPASVSFDIIIEWTSIACLQAVWDLKFGSRVEVLSKS